MEIARTTRNASGDLDVTHEATAALCSSGRHFVALNPSARLCSVTTATTPSLPGYSRFVPTSFRDKGFIAFFGVALYLVASIIYNVVNYQSLGVVSVLIAAIIFVGIFGVYAFFSLRNKSEKLGLPHNSWSWMWASGVGLFAWVSSFPAQSQYGNYYPAFPLDKIDAGGSIAQDTIFHSTLIHSIINFGYPSTGLSDVPWVVYHTLSHYVEAAIYTISGLLPFDSAGLFFSLKIMLTVATLIVFLWRVTVKRNVITFFGALVVVLPILLSRYTIVGSLALWFTTFVLIATAIYTHNSLSSSTKITNWNLGALGFVGAVLVLGKISTGVMYMLVVGIHLFMAHRRDTRIYLLGLGWFIFIATYGWFFTLDRGLGSEGWGAFTISERLTSLVNFLTLHGKFVPFTLDLYALGLAICVIFVVYRRPNSLRQLTSLVVGFTAIGAMWFMKMSSNDIRYFEQALFFIVLTLVVIDFFAISPNEQRVVWPNRTLKPQVAFGIVTVLIVLSTAGMGRSPINLFSPSRTTIVEAFSPPEIRQIAYNPDLTTFRRSLNSFMTSRGLTSRDSLVFIPREIWTEKEQQFTASNTIKKAWVNPLLVYATTGVPLINGIVDFGESYGFSAYNPGDRIVSLTDFDNTKPCRFGKTIVIVTSWSPAEFSTQCDQGNG